MEKSIKKLMKNKKTKWIMEKNNENKKNSKKRK